MGESIRNGKRKQAQGRWGCAARGAREFLQFRTAGWEPAINAYCCEGCIRVCVDLAGVDKSGLELSVQPRLLTIRGQREAPEPAGKEHSPLQVLAMEIDYGPFERQVELPDEVDTNQVTAQQSNGFVWIYLPFQTHA